MQSPNIYIDCLKETADVTFQKGNTYRKGKSPWNKGIPHTNETKRKIGIAGTGRLHTKETRRKMSKSHKGKHHSEKTKQKMSRSAKGVPKTEEHKLNLSIARTGVPNHKTKGVPKSEETKKNMALNHANVSGNNNPNWRGGISFEPYCDKFNGKLKESIRNRDNRTCQLCGKLEIDNIRKLDVHHIHYDKPNCKPDLIALCHRCNLKVNYNRDYYEELFTNKLIQRGILNQP